MKTITQRLKKNQKADSFLKKQGKCIKNQGQKKKSTIKKLKTNQSVKEYGVLLSSLKKDLVDVFPQPNKKTRKSFINRENNLESSRAFSVEHSQQQKGKRQKQSQLIKSKQNKYQSVAFRNTNSLNKLHAHAHAHHLLSSKLTQNRNKIKSMSKLKPMTATTISNSSLKQILISLQRMQIKHQQQLKDIKGLTIRQKKRLEKIHQLQERQLVIKVSAMGFKRSIITP